MAEAKAKTSTKQEGKSKEVVTQKSNKATVKTAEKAVAKTTTKKIEELIETEAIAEAIVEAESEIAQEAPVVIAKAGKRSAKALKESEEKQAKENRKVALDDEIDQKPKIVQKPTRSRVERKGKKYREATKLIEKNKEYSLTDALELAVKTSPVKFDASVELHVNLGVDPRQADQNVRDTVVLPAGTGKNIRIAVFAEADDAAKAKKAGADIAANEEFLAQLDKGTIDFDVLIATPQQMAKLGKYARVLGPKGLMPNPKSGTVTTDVVKAVSEAKAGRVEYRVDSTGIIHISVGKVSFGTAKLRQNADAVIASIRAAKPASLKGNYIKAVYVASTMGPSIRIVASELS